MDRVFALLTIVLISCGGPAPVADDDLKADGVFGVLADGADCLFDVRCQSRVCVPEATYGPATWRCAQRRARRETCDSSQDCQQGLTCLRWPYANTYGTCEIPCSAEKDPVCAEGLSCNPTRYWQAVEDQSAALVGRCEQPGQYFAARDDGQPCLSDFDCKSGACVPGAVHRPISFFCAPKRSKDQPCDGDPDCQAGLRCLKDMPASKDDYGTCQIP